LEAISEVAKKHDLIVISDEVYEGMVYDNTELVRMATLPGMWERTISIGSAGKTFSATGFKIGWVVGPKELTEAVFMVHQNVPFCVATPLQEAVAIAFEKLLEEQKNYFPRLRDIYQKKRDKMSQILVNSGLIPIKPQGSYFILAETGQIPKEIYVKNQKSNKDYEFCRWLANEIGVVGIPPSAFYSPEKVNLAASYARFAFCKKDETMEEAAKRLEKLKQYIK